MAGPRSSAGSILRVTMATSSDAGVYQCRVSSDHGDVVVQAHAVVILGASVPNLEYRFIAHTLQPGPAVSLKCIARGTPTPHIAWTLDGFPLPQSHRIVMGQYVSSHGSVISHVNVSSVHVTDGGLYQCTAENVAGAVRHSAKLNIYGPPTIRQMGQLTAVAGKTFSVTCPVGGHPIDKITWMKDGVELPLNHQQTVHMNGTLILSAVTRAKDEGSYSCSAIDRQGRSDSRSLLLQVKVPPRIGQIAFVGGTTAGLRAHATCLVLGGDTPITLLWSKDGQELQQSNNVVVTEVNKFTSLLAIEKTSGKDSGNYTCTASNKASSTMSSAFLTVSVPPVWIVEPTDGTVSLLHALELPCTARGFPQPLVTWRKQTESGNWGRISSSGGSTGHSGTSHILGGRFPRKGIRYSSDGIPRKDSRGLSVLTIVSANRDHAGRYLCQANNGVGTGLSKLITITVYEPPWFAEVAVRTEVQKNKTASLLCHARGDQPLTMYWVRNNVHLQTSSKYSVQTQGEGEQAVLQLLVHDAVAADSGSYECRANNSHGVNSTHLQLRVQDVPEVPSALTVIDKGSRIISLSWSANSVQNDSSDSKSIVTYASESGVSGTLTVYGTTAVVEGLQPATLYSFSVVAENRVGRSGQSETVTETTMEEPPSGFPLHVKVDSITATTLHLRWDPPSDNLTNGQLCGYYLGYRENSFSSTVDNKSYNFTAVPLNDPGHHHRTLCATANPSHGEFSDAMPKSSMVTRYNVETPLISVTRDGVVEVSLTGLKPHTRYAMVVKAFNSKGSGPSSPALTAKTMEDKPSAPPKEVTCEAVTSSRIVVKWLPPRHESVNGVVTSYKVSYGEDVREDHVITGNHPPRDNSEFYIANFLTYEDGSYNGNINRVTKERNGGFGKVISNVGNNNANTVGNGVIVVTKGLTAILTNLMPYSHYEISVSASTMAGEGVTSRPQTCTTLEDVPSAPTSLKCISSGPNSVIVSWAKPKAPNGAITHYSVHWVQSGSRQSPTVQTVDANTFHITLENLLPRQVEVWLSAQTSIGRGKASNRVTVTPSLEVSAGVWSLGGSVAVPWKEDMTLHCRAVGDPRPTLRWTFNDSNLQQDSRVSVSADGSLRLLDAQRSSGGRYRCTATNRHGSDSVTYDLHVLMPPSPPVLQVTQTTSSSVRLQWAVHNDGGSALVRATLYYRASGGDTEEVGMRQNIHTVSKLRCGTLYYFFSTVRNGIGTSESSPVVEARTKGRAPEPPPQFQFITSNSSQATLYLTQWESGGCDITHFRVQYRKLHGKDWTTVSSNVPMMRTFAVGGLQHSQQYELRVTAYNTAGSTPSVYTWTTASSTGGHSISGLGGGDSWTADHNNLYSNRSKSVTVWRDPRLLVPVIASLSAITLTIAAVYICLRKRHGKAAHSEDVKESSNGSFKDHHDFHKESSKEDHLVQHFPETEVSISGEPHGDDIYHYASSSYQFGCLSSEPPDCTPADQERQYSPDLPPQYGAVPLLQPPTHQPQGPDVPLHMQHASFTALVYQSPSLYNVDDAGLSRGESYREIPDNGGMESGYSQIFDCNKRDDRTLPLYHGSTYQQQQHLHKQKQRVQRYLKVAKDEQGHHITGDKPRQINEKNCQPMKNELDDKQPRQQKCKLKQLKFDKGLNVTLHSKQDDLVEEYEGRPRDVGTLQPDTEYTDQRSRRVLSEGTPGQTHKREAR